MARLGQTGVRPFAGRTFSLRPLLVFLASLILVAQLFAARPPAREYEMKAAMIYHFASFVEWPASATTQPLVIGVIGDDPFGPTLDRTFEGKTIAGRPFEVRRIHRSGNLSGCQMLFVSSTELDRLPEILPLLAKNHVLTIGDAAGFAGMGGVIGFTQDDTRIRLEINVQAAKRAGLRISSKLLRLASLI